MIPSVSSAQVLDHHEQHQDHKPSSPHTGRAAQLSWIWSFMIGMLLSACASPHPPADIVIGPTGCNTQNLTLAANQKPELVVENTAQEPMVVSLPNWNDTVTVAPGARGVLALEPFAWGDIDFYCLTEANHTRAGGGPMAAGLVCGLDPYSIRPLALSSGIIRVEQHNRLRNAIGG